MALVCLRCSLKNIVFRFAGWGHTCKTAAEPTVIWRDACVLLAYAGENAVFAKPQYGGVTHHDWRVPRNRMNGDGAGREGDLPAVSLISSYNLSITPLPLYLEIETIPTASSFLSISRE